MLDKGKGWWFLGAMVVIIVAAAAVCIGSTAGKTDSTRPSPAVTQEEEAGADYDTSFFGVVKSVDEIEGTITIYDTEAGIDRTLTYTGGSRVLDRYDTERSMSWLSAGELVDVYYYQASYRLTRVEVSKEAWEYGGISRFRFDMTKQRVTIAEQLYRYEKDLFITGAGQELELIDINARDELMMKGVGDRVYSVIITKGHGYIRLANYEAFLGGTIEVGYGIIMPIVEDMLISAREGTYKVTLEKGELSGTKEVTILRDEESVLDMAEFKIEEERTGEAVFMIDPEGAKLYINGIETDYSKKVKLNYGDYQIRVELEGYSSFSGVLTVGEKTPVICVSLSVDGADTSGTTDGVTLTPSGEDAADTSDTTDAGTDEATEQEDTADSTEEETDTQSTVSGVGTTLIDEDHVITISAPEGAKVYWNGAYKGSVPVTFAKEIGNHVVTFSQTGYLTRSYSCEIVDDGEDVTLNFADMVKKETN